MARSQELTEAISAMISQQPFFAVLMFDLLNVVEGEVVPTAATDGRNLYVNPKFFKGLTPKQRVGVMAHEVLHVVHRHPARGKGYRDRGFGPDLKPWNHEKFNHAADYVINQQLHDAGLELPIGALFHPSITSNDLVDEVYCKIPDPPENEKNFDSHMDGDDQQMPDKAAVQRAVASARNHAKAMGKFPGSLAQMCGEIIEPKVDWREKFRQWIVNTTGGDVATWKRPNKRKLAVAPHMYLPGRTGMKTGPIAVEIDRSGSACGNGFLETFLGALHEILRDVRPEKTYAMFVDTQVYGEVHELDDPGQIQDLKNHAGGGGGTDMEVVFKEIDERGLEVEYVVILTDGYVNFGEPRPIPTLWVITTPDINAPWGDTIHITVDQEMKEAA